MKIRIFATNECQNCLQALLLCKQNNVDFEYVDAFEDTTQQFCDDNNVDELPHIQFLDDNNILIVEHIGEINTGKFMEYLLLMKRRENGT